MIAALSPLRPLRPPVAWLMGAALGGWFLLHLSAVVMRAPLERFDGGILYAATTMLANGQVPMRDYYIPYGPALGAIGLPAHWLGGDRLYVIQMSYMAMCAAMVVLLTAYLGRRFGWLVAAAGGILGMLCIVPRYAVCWCALIGCLLLLERALSPARGNGLAGALEAHPRLVFAAGAVLGLAPWFRPEYMSLTACWAIAIVVTLRRSRHALWLAATPAAVGVLPFLLIAALGGLHGMVAYAGYAIHGFPVYRRLPFDRAFPKRWLVGMLAGAPAADDTGLVLSYLVGACAVGLFAVNLLLPRAWRPVRPDPSGVSLFVVLACSVVLSAQSVRFAATSGLLAIPIFWLALLVPAYRWLWVRPAMVLAGLLVASTLLRPYASAGPDAVAAWRETAHAQPPRFGHLTLAPSETASFPALVAAWSARHAPGSRMMSINIRNDRSGGNEVLPYWLLDARPAAWPIVFDPGLANSDSVEREAAASLCSFRAAVVQHTGTYDDVSLRPGVHFSRYLDQYVALNYDVVMSSDLYRLLEPRPGPCVMPEAVSSQGARDTRDRLLGDREAEMAGAISVLLIDRARAGGTDPDPQDLAAAGAAGYIP